jgi:hypothetical protein
MRGLKLLSVSALAANKGAVDRQSVGLKSVEKPLAVEEPLFGRRKALQSILAAGAAGVTAVVAPKSALALDMDAFMNSEVSKRLVS